MGESDQIDLIFWKKIYTDISYVIIDKINEEWAE